MVRKKHEKSKRGFKQTSDAFLNQVEILGGKGVIYTTPYSNGNYYFRTWIKDEKKYIRKSLRTKILDDAITMGENEMLGVMTKIKQGHKVFGVTFGELCNEFLQHTQSRVDTNRITKGRYSTINTQIKRLIMPYIGNKETVASLDRNSFFDYGMYRRKKTDNLVWMVLLNVVSKSNQLKEEFKKELVSKIKGIRDEGKNDQRK